MTRETAIKLFDQKKIRSVWKDEEEKWYFSIIDVIGVLTETDRPRKYWSDLKSKLTKEGSELSEKIGQLKLKAEDGKMRVTDIADTEQLFRLIQSIPLPQAYSCESYPFFHAVKISFCSSRQRARRTKGKDRK